MHGHVNKTLNVLILCVHVFENYSKEDETRMLKTCMK